jgi:hypothetical protein
VLRVFSQLTFENNFPRLHWSFHSQALRKPRKTFDCQIFIIAFFHELNWLIRDLKDATGCYQPPNVNTFQNKWLWRKSFCSRVTFDEFRVRKRTCEFQRLAHHTLDGFVCCVMLNSTLHFRTKSLTWAEHKRRERNICKKSEHTHTYTHEKLLKQKRNFFPTWLHHFSFVLWQWTARHFTLKTNRTRVSISRTKSKQHGCVCAFFMLAIFSFCIHWYVWFFWFSLLLFFVLCCHSRIMSKNGPANHLSRARSSRIFLWPIFSPGRGWGDHHLWCYGFCEVNNTNFPFNFKRCRCQRVPATEVYFYTDQIIRFQMKNHCDARNIFFFGSSSKYRAHSITNSFFYLVLLHNMNFIRNRASIKRLLYKGKARTRTHKLKDTFHRGTFIFSRQRDDTRVKVGSTYG